MRNRRLLAVRFPGLRPSIPACFCSPWAPREVRPVAAAYNLSKLKVHGLLPGNLIIPEQRCKRLSQTRSGESPTIFVTMFWRVGWLTDAWLELGLPTSTTVCNFNTWFTCGLHFPYWSRMVPVALLGSIVIFPCKTGQWRQVRTRPIRQSGDGIIFNCSSASLGVRPL